MNANQYLVGIKIVHAYRSLEMSQRSPSSNDPTTMLVTNRTGIVAMNRDFINNHNRHTWHCSVLTPNFTKFCSIRFAQLFPTSDDCDDRPSTHANESSTQNVKPLFHFQPQSLAVNVVIFIFENSAFSLIFSVQNCSVASCWMGRCAKSIRCGFAF